MAHAMNEQQSAVPERPVMVVMVGTPGTGKSFLARLLAPELGAGLVQTDVVRKRRFREPKYTPAESAVTYMLAHKQARRMLAERQSVIFDATNLIEHNRRQLYRIAEEAGAGLLIVWTYAPDHVVRERMQARAQRRDPLDVSDADLRVHALMRERVDPIPRPHFVVNTAVDLGSAVRRLVAEARLLGGRAGPSPS
jgi:predicted kinase